MPDYRRWFVPGGTYFFTVVTHCRRPLLCDKLARECLREAIETVRELRAVEIVAIVLQPDHLHTVWTLPKGDADYSTRWRRIKEEFTRAYLPRGGMELPPSPSRLRHAERGVWQRRFWEHLVRDEEDLKRCVDYVHWNPKKHGHVSNIRDWPWSSFHRYVKLGEYDLDWGAEDPAPGYDEPEWGESIRFVGWVKRSADPPFSRIETWWVCAALDPPYLASFHRYVKLGEYDLDWGAEDPAPGYDEPEWGE